MYRKYNNQKTEIQGIKFDSKKESNRYLELKLLQKSKYIIELQCQVPFILQDSFIDYTGKKQQPIKYIADFVYIENGNIVAEDVKGFKTKEYLIKRKLLMNKFPYLIFKEV